MFKRNRKWTRKEKGRFLLSIGQLLDQGYSLGEAIELIGIQHRSQIRKQTFIIIKNLKEGRPLHEVFSHNHFPRIVAGLLYFAEQHGNLSFAFTESGKLLLKQEQLVKDLVKLIRYPILLCIITIVVLTVILNQLLPQFQALYQSLDVELPTITTILLNVIQFSPLIIISIIILICITTFSYMRFLKKLSPLERMKFFLKVPVLNSLLTLFVTHYFSIQLSYLLKGGLSIYESLSTFENQSYFKFFQLEAVNLKQSLKEGLPFSSLLANNPLYTQELTYVVAHGLANSSLSEELNEYSGFLYETFEENFKMYVAVFQPILFSLIGIIILLLFSSVLIPMFHLLNSL